LGPDHEAVTFLKNEEGIKPGKKPNDRVNKGIELEGLLLGVEFRGIRGSDVAIAKFERSLWRKNFNINKIDDELEEFGKKAGIGLSFQHAKVRPDEHLFEGFEVVSLSFVSKIFEFESKSGPQFVKKEKPSCVRSHEHQPPVLFEGAADFFKTKSIIFNMFQVIQTDNEVKGLASERK
jgi:hypothetical protein